MPFSPLIAPGHNGANWTVNIHLGKAWITILASSNYEVFGRAADTEQLLDSLVVNERVRQKREETPSLLAIVSQSVMIMQFVDEETGIDCNKRINGRKRSIAVDRLWLPWSVAVTATNISDNEAGRLVVDRLKGKVPRLKTIVADHGYKVSFVDCAEDKGWQVEIVQKPESSRGFVPEKNRWMVERSFGCGSPLGLNFRRPHRRTGLFRDVEKTVESSEAMLQIAFISIIINRFAK